MSRLIRWSGIALTVAALAAVSGCMRPIEAISTSNTVLDFELNTAPITFQVWNNNPEAGTLNIDVRPNRDWILTNVGSVQSAAPPDGAGSNDFDKQNVRVTIDRTQLGIGEFTGRIDLTADGVVTRSVEIRVESDTANVGEPLNIVNPEVAYSAPYLLDFNFALRDANGEAQVAEPAQFQITASEGDQPVTFETGLQIRRGAARQLLVELVLDYSLTLQSVPGAIGAMEDAAKNIFLPALNSDALVGVTEFHVEDQDAARVAQFTTDRDFLRMQINRIQSDFVQGFAGFARIFDTIVQTAAVFDGEDPETEDRYIVLFTDGNDTASQNDINDAIGAANEKNISIYAVGIGANVDENTLIELAANTDGLYFPSDDASDLADAFTKVINDLEAQYSVRWASGQRMDRSFTPRFTLELGNASVTYVSPERFNPTDYPGDVRQGQLFLVESDNTQTTTVFLRAQYVPRQITQMVIEVSSAFDFDVERVEVGENGLVGDWNIDVDDLLKQRSVRITLTSPDGEPLRFASLGPLLRFDFNELLGPEVDIFSAITVDNSVYNNGQSFIIEGF